MSLIDVEVVEVTPTSPELWQRLEHMHEGLKLLLERTHRMDTTVQEIQGQVTQLTQVVSDQATAITANTALLVQIKGGLDAAIDAEDKAALVALSATLGTAITAAQSNTANLVAADAAAAGTTAPAA